MCGVLIMASLGCNNARQVSVPDLTGMSREEARAALEEAGIALEERNQAEPEELVGKVVGQEPSAGEKLVEGASVIIFVGASSLVEVPDLVGLTQEEASVKLAELGLSPALSTQDTSDEAIGGIVLTQEPAAGTSIDKQGLVALGIGNYVPAATASGSSTGSGSQGSSSATCSRCGGSGTINAPIHEKRFVTCPMCGGRYPGNQCTNCGGMGSITVDSERPIYVTCPTCGGTGRISR